MQWLHSINYLLLLHVILILTDAAVAARNGHGLTVRAAETHGRVFRLALLEARISMCNHLQNREKQC